MRSSRSSGERRRTWLALALLTGIAGLAIAVRVGWIVHVKVDPMVGHFDDTVFYFASAKSLAHDFTYRDQFDRFSAHWPPGYPLALAGVFALVGTKLAAAKALNVALSAATVLLTYVVGARVFGTRTGFVAALLLAVAPGHVYFSSLVMAEVLFCFGFLAVIAMFLFWTVDVPSISWWWWFREADGPAFHTSTFSKSQEPKMLALGIATGYLTLVRSEAVFLPPIFMAFWLVVVPRWRPLLWHSAVFCSGFILALTPWTVRNAIQFHELLPLRDGSQGGLANGLDRNYLHRPSRFSAPAPPLGEVAGYMARHPWELVPLEGAKLRYLYRDDSDGIDWLQHDGNGPFTFAEAQRWSQLADRYFFAIGLCALAAAPALWWRRDRGRVVLAYLFVAWTAILVISWPETRYHLPLVPILCMFAAWTIVSAVGGAAAAVRSLSRRARVAARPSDRRDELAPFDGNGSTLA